MNAENNTGLKPLHYASATGNGEAVPALAETGADVNAKNKKGLSPLDIAKETGNPHICELPGTA